MASLQFRRCVWLLNTIVAHEPITRADINSYYRHDDYVNPYEYEEIPLRTFQKDLKNIEDIFDVEIYCNRATNEYTIKGAKEAGLSRSRKLTTIDIAKRDIQLRFEKEVPVQLFRIDATPEAAERLRDFPVCPEQTEVMTNEKTGLTVFEYLFRPTLEWYEAIRSMGAAVKVLYPNWLAELVKEDAQGVANMYESTDGVFTGRTFIDPYQCHILDRDKSPLYLNIQTAHFEGLINGLIDEYNVRLCQDNVVHLIEFEDGYDHEKRDEDNNVIPRKYDLIHFKVGNDFNASEALVEVKKAESFILTDKADQPTGEEIITYTLGKILQIWQPKEE